MAVAIADSYSAMTMCFVPRLCGNLQSLIRQSGLETEPPSLALLGQ